MLNHIIIQGRITKDPELRRTQNQTFVTTFTVAVDRDFGDKETDFIQCVAWRSTAEFVSKYFQKGSLIVVSGKLQSRRYTDKSGAEKIAWEVVADSVYFCESRKKSADVTAEDYDDTDVTVNKRPFEEYEDTDDELPF